MIIKKKSKCIFIINGKRFDSRKSKIVGSNLRKCLYQYVSNGELSFGQVDSLVCRLMNRNLVACSAISNNSIVIN
jgi:hypothetical protein